MEWSDGAKQQSDESKIDWIADTLNTLEEAVIVISPEETASIAAFMLTNSAITIRVITRLLS